MAIHAAQRSRQSRAIELPSNRIESSVESSSESVCVDRLVGWLVGWCGCVGWQVLKVLEGHTDGVWAVAISTDGAKIVSGSDDNTVRVWSMETGEVLPAFLK